MAAKNRSESSTTRELIPAAALKLVSRTGYAGTSIAMICQEAGLNASSLYWFFDNKEDLFLCLIKESADEFLRSLALPDASDGATPTFDVDGFIDAAVLRLERNGDFLRLLLVMMLEERSLSPEVKNKIAEIRAGSMVWWRSFLTQLFQPLGNTTATLLAADFAPFCRATINGAFIAHQYGEALDIRDILRKLTLLFGALLEEIRREQLPE